MGGSPGELSDELVMQGEAKEGLENELSRDRRVGE